MKNKFQICPNITVGNNEKLLLLAGPCVIESYQECQIIASTMQQICQDLNINYVFKASFDKANRTSIDSFRGPGLQKGLQILQKIKEEFNLPIVTDIHDPQQAKPVAQVADILQIPAFLCRQTDLLIAAGNTGKTVNIKKGQFLAPEDMKPLATKIETTKNNKILLTERGTTFGYHNLVVDMRSLITMAELNYPIIFDATHAVQTPGGNGNSSGGRREFVYPLARAAAATGIDGLFLEVHPNPNLAKSDGTNMLKLQDVRQILEKVQQIYELNL